MNKPYFMSGATSRIQRKQCADWSYKIKRRKQNGKVLLKTAPKDKMAPGEVLVEFTTPKFNKINTPHSFPHLTS